MWEDYYRKQANQRRAELQQVLHRSSALCTLAHALLLDQAANDPMLQVRTAKKWWPVTLSVSPCTNPCHLPPHALLYLVKSPTRVLM